MEHEVILQFSTAYFIADTLFYMLPWIFHTDALFILHHIATSGYMLWSLQIGRGAISSLMLMFLGEITGVFFNPWLAARDWKKATKGRSKAANIVFEVFTYPYSLLFVFVRGVVAPFVLLSMSVQLLRSPHLDAPTRYVWTAIIAASYILSLTWVKKLAVGFAKHVTHHLGVGPRKLSRD
eukprot:CAMPEP_0177589800 /NCGR_PEP_ID=MMETSP0419_2-20121207/7024_1 /TAXON_ID=582737 /ORGANISM="Tetraselmis sp., Strain GSL018" /LENGTH=179 /DNA_ID=CAMNT_0019080233 /DNA_START=419 /DNA_END=958 /DNA_ORIENTATION=+